MSERAHTPADVRERVVDEIVSTLRTPRGEGEMMDADEMWFHWSSGHESAALLGLRTASDDEAHRFLSMLADWQRCPMPSDHDVAAALRSEASGQGGIHPDPETWRCRQCGGYAAHYRDCPALRSEAQGEDSRLAQIVRAILERIDRYQDFHDRVGPADLTLPPVARTITEEEIFALRAALRSEAQGEGWQVTEPARDIVRREMPETRATVREAIRAARRGEGGE